METNNMINAMLSIVVAIVILGAVLLPITASVSEPELNVEHQNANPIYTAEVVSTSDVDATITYSGDNVIVGDYSFPFSANNGTYGVIDALINNLLISEYGKKIYPVDVANNRSGTSYSESIALDSTGFTYVGGAITYTGEIDGNDVLIPSATGDYSAYIHNQGYANTYINENSKIYAIVYTPTQFKDADNNALDRTFVVAEGTLKDGMTIRSAYTWVTNEWVEITQASMTMDFVDNEDGSFKGQTGNTTGVTTLTYNDTVYTCKGINVLYVPTTYYTYEDQDTIQQIVALIPVLVAVGILVGATYMFISRKN